MTYIKALNNLKRYKICRKQIDINIYNNCNVTLYVWFAMSSKVDIWWKRCTIERW